MLWTQCLLHCCGTDTHPLRGRRRRATLDVPPRVCELLRVCIRELPQLRRPLFGVHHERAAQGRLHSSPLATWSRAK